jgi:SpoVK/Ycf46/Vps4 family AAA+-type ATPase
LMRYASTQVYFSNHYRHSIYQLLFFDFLQVDSMLGRRENPGEHEAMRKMKNEFMVNWDGLRTKDKERVLVLGATNRPFDLDEAVIRRFPRR